MPPVLHAIHSMHQIYAIGVGVMYISLAPTQHCGSFSFITECIRDCKSQLLLCLAMQQKQCCFCMGSLQFCLQRNSLDNRACARGWLDPRVQTLGVWMAPTLRDKWTPCLQRSRIQLMKAYVVETSCNPFWMIRLIAIYTYAHQDLFVSWSRGVSGQKFCTKLMDT